MLISLQSLAQASSLRWSDVPIDMREAKAELCCLANDIPMLYHIIFRSDSYDSYAATELVKYDRL